MRFPRNVKLKSIKVFFHHILTKDLKIFIILLVLFFCSFLTLNLTFFNASNESETIEISIPEKDPLYKGYSKTIQIKKPNSNLNQKFPTIILLNGDNLNGRSMNLIEKEFLANNYAVVLVNLEFFDGRAFIELDLVLNELLNKSYIDSERIGILGHSHGAYIAYFFAGFALSSIKAVVCGNIVNYEDFIKIDPNNISVTPRNVLILINSIESKHDQSPEHYLNYISLGTATDINTLYGSFKYGTAREVYVIDSVFTHATSLYDPKAIQKEISWMNQALSLDSENFSGLFTLWIEVISLFLIFSLLCITGFGLVAKITIQLPKIEKYSKKFFRNNISKFNKNFQNNLIKSGKKDDESIQPSSLLPSTEKSRENFEPVSKIVNLEKTPNIISQKDDVLVISNENLLKNIQKISIFLLFSLFSIIILQYIYYQIVFWLPVLHQKTLNDGITFIFKLVGWNTINLEILFDSGFPFGYMYLWTLCFLILDKLSINKSNLTKVTEYSIKDHFHSFYHGFLMFSLVWVMLNILTSFLLGYKIPFIHLKNLALAFFVLYSVNSITLQILQEYFNKQSKGYLKLFCFTVTIYILLLIPSVLFTGLGKFFQDYLVYVILALLNPVMYKKGINILSITWFNYFILLFFYLWVF